MCHLNKIIAIVITSLISLMAQADEAQIRESLAKLPKPVKADSISSTPMKGLYEVMVGPNVFYVSEDGKYIIQGSLIEIATRTDLTELKLAKMRVDLIAGIDEAKTIAFTPEEVKHKIFVFTDIDCGYCRKLHKEIDQYMAQGIKVQYLLFPRAGVGSASYDKAVAVWCTEDRATALTKAKQGQDPGKKTCDNPVQEHLQFGAVLGLTGTPMMITEKGTIFPGYIPAEQLVSRLENEEAR